MNTNKSIRGKCFDSRDPYISYRFYDIYNMGTMLTYTGFRFMELAIKKDKILPHFKPNPLNIKYYKYIS